MPDTRRWRGNAPVVAQVQTVTIYHVEDGVVFVLTHAGKSVTVTADDQSTPTTIAAALATLWNAEIIPQFAEITAAASGGSITLTADNAGVPFDVTATQTGTGGNGEIKTVTLTHSPTGGTWSWIDSTYGTASSLAYNVSAANLTTALEVLYGAGNVVATGSDGGPYTVTFSGDMAHINVPDITFDHTSLTGGDATVSVVETVKGAAGTSEVQTITFYGTPSGGTFTASFEGFGTAALAYNISAANLQTALRALTPIGSTGASVTGSDGGPYTVTFGGTLANTAVENIVIDPAGLTGGTISGATATTTEGVLGQNMVQYLIQEGGNVNATVSLEKSGTVTSGTFTISYGGETTDPLPYDITSHALATALDALLLAVQGTGSYTGPYFVSTSYPGPEAYIGHYANYIALTLIGTYGDINAGFGPWPFGVNPTVDSTGLSGGGSYLFPGPAYSAAGSNNGYVGGTAGVLRLQYGTSLANGLAFATANGYTDTVITSPTVAQVQAEMDALAGAGNVLVEAFAQPTSTAVAGGRYTKGSARALFKFTFQGALAGTNVSGVYGSFTTQPTGLGISAVASTVVPYTAQRGIPGTNEVQTVTLSGTPSHGTFTLSFGAATTAAIAYNASAADVKTALIALPNIGDDDVTCTGGALPGTPVTITYTGALGYLDVAQLVINDSGLKVVTTETTPGVTATNEVQTISLVGSPHDGTATLTYNGHTTAGIAWNAAAAAVQSALIALSDFDTGDVVCTGGPWPTHGIVVTFGGAFVATDVAAITGTGTALDNGVPVETSINPIVYPYTTPNSGPNDISVAANWSGETLPVTGDTVVIDQGSSDMLYHLDQLATGIAAFYHYARYTGAIGLPEVNTSLGDNYYEFRQQYLIVDSTTISVGIGDGDGSGRMKIQGVSGTTPVVNVYQTSNALDIGIPALLLVLPNASSVLNVNRGSVGVAIYPGETSTIPTVRVGFETNQAGDSTVVFGAGCTLTTIEQSGGKVTTNSAVVTLNMTAGELVHETGAFTTANIDGGAVRYKSASTLTTAVVSSGGVLDFRQDLRARTLTNLSLHKGAEYRDPHGTVALTNGADFVRCQPSDCVFEVIPNRTWTPSVI